VEVNAIIQNMFSSGKSTNITWASRVVLVSDRFHANIRCILEIIAIIVYEEVCFLEMSMET